MDKDAIDDGIGIQRNDPFFEIHLRPPGLAVLLVGSDPASEIYVAAKRRDCEQVGYHSIVEHLSYNVTQEDLEEIAKYEDFVGPPRLGLHALPKSQEPQILHRLEMQI